MLIILSGNQDSNFNPVLLKVKLCADLQTTKLVAQSSQSRPRNNLSFCSDDCSYQSQLRTIIWALHLTSPSEAFLDSEHFQRARRGPGCAASCSPSSRSSWLWPRSPSPSSTPSRWSRSTREQSSSGRTNQKTIWFHTHWPIIIECYWLLTNNIAVLLFNNNQPDQLELCICAS